MYIHVYVIYSSLRFILRSQTLLIPPKDKIQNSKQNSVTLFYLYEFLGYFVLHVHAGVFFRNQKVTLSSLVCTFSLSPHIIGNRISVSVIVVSTLLSYEASTSTRTRYGYGDTYNIQNIERSTSVVLVSDTDTDACQTPNTTRD